tara:strand:+ start:580 stop:894 length:315 start_codon:yes stop_codon:yes gene_type:complete
MNFVWIIYYFLIFLICYLFSKLNKNKLINYFFIPIIFGVFGSLWFINPGDSSLAPIISIIFLEFSIMDSNGLERLIRPLISSILILEILSLFLFLLIKIKTSRR